TPLPMYFVSFILRPTPEPPLFPYTTLFRSGRRRIGGGQGNSGSRRHRLSAQREMLECGTTRRRRRRSRELRAGAARYRGIPRARSEEHTSELQSRFDLVCRLLLEKKKEYKT